MRDHPIPPVTDLLQYRAIGVVRGKYVPEDPEHFSRGSIIDEKGDSVEAVVLGKVISLMKRCLSVEKSHLWVVYPRCRDSEHLHLQISGIWEPSTLKIPLDKKAEETPKNNSDQVKEGDDYFSIRGELIYTKPENHELVLKIRQKKRQGGKKSFPFKLNLNGEIPIDYLRNFVSLDVRRVGQQLLVEEFQIIGPLKNKNTKFAKN